MRMSQRTDVDGNKTVGGKPQTEGQERREGQHLKQQGSPIHFWIYLGPAGYNSYVALISRLPEFVLQASFRWHQGGAHLLPRGRFFVHTSPPVSSPPSIVCHSGAFPCSLVLLTAGASVCCDLCGVAAVFYWRTNNYCKLGWDFLLCSKLSALLSLPGSGVGVGGGRSAARLSERVQGATLGLPYCRVKLSGVGAPDFVTCDFSCV